MYIQPVKEVTKMSTSNTSLSFILPSTQTPLFTAEWLTCAYPVSDLYAAFPRYLYYALLLLVFLTQWHSWLANVFLGVVATYAGTAAIEVFVLIANKPKMGPPTAVSVPFISPASVPGNDTLSQIPSLVTNATTLFVQPAALEYDIDATLAIIITGYLMMLPMHCWSSAVRASRARHLLIFLWNLLMFAGMICSILLWPTLYDAPLQYRFCYPGNIDSDYVTSDGHYGNSIWRGDWNSTIWNVFQDFEIAADLADNCLYPCFNTSQVLRRPSSLVGAIVNGTPNPRLDYALQWAHIGVPNGDPDSEWSLAGYMYSAIIVTTLIMLVFLLFVLTPARKVTRVPIERPKELFWSARKEILHLLWNEFKQGMSIIIQALHSPKVAYTQFRAMSNSALQGNTRIFLRFLIDILALIILFVAMFLTPATIVIFIVWIESYIHHDLVSSEAPQQVGQWGTVASVALILISALVLRLKYVMASKIEVQNEIAEVREHLIELEKLLEEKRGEEDRSGGVDGQLATV